MLSAMRLPVMRAMTIKASSVGRRLKSPSIQSNTKSSAMRPAGVMNAPTISGS